MSREARPKFQKVSLSADEAERLFATVDETGHSNEGRARRERRHRHDAGVSVEVDPLSGDDPAGDDTERRIQRTAVTLTIVVLVAVIAAQLAYSIVRRLNTRSLAESATVSTVADALHVGVEWGDGYTSFPQEFSVQEADENTGRIEVTVVDSTSTNALQCFAQGQIQATAFSVNALLNPKIDTVVYNVNVHLDDDGNFEHDSLFGFLRPKGNITTFMTFTWTKAQYESGVQFSCTISGLDAQTEQLIRDSITTSYTPVTVVGDN